MKVNVLREKMKPIYQSSIVLNPKGPGLVSEAQIKMMKVFPDHIRIGRQDLTFDEMVSRRIQDDCIQFWNGKETVRFGVQGLRDKGIPDANLTVLTNQLLDAISNGREKEIQYCLDALKTVGRTFHIRNGIAVLLVVLLGGSLPLVGLCPPLLKLIESHPVITIIGALVAIGFFVPYAANGITRLITKKRNRRTRDSTVPSEGAPSDVQ